MKVQIYKVKHRQNPSDTEFLMLKSGDLISDELLKKLGELVFFREMEILPGEKRIALDSDEAIRDIENKGYHIQGTRIEISVS